MYWPTLTLALLGLSVQLPSVYGWGAAGHEIIATIAQVHLHPTALTRICSILYPDNPSSSCHIAPIAAWADKIRIHARWSGPLHYVGSWDDHPSDTCVFPGEGGWNGKKNENVLGGVRNVTGILVEWVEQQRNNELSVSNDARAEEALKFLVHFIGDMHMPLHLTGRDRGGNGAKVSFDGRVTNLHSLWDSLLLSQRLRTLPRNYTHPIPLPSVERNLRGAIYDPYIRRVFWEGLREGGKWFDEVNDWLTCPEVPMEPSAPAAQSKSYDGGRSIGWFGSVSSLTQSIVAIIGLQPRTGTTMDPTDDTTICPYAWAKPIHQLNCDLVWPSELNLTSNAPRPRHPDYPELDIPEYAGRIKDEWVLERLMAMGGVRLAGVLNWLFADPEEVGLWVQ
ncbi:hypothetical protein JAAARDRAFT_67657 [Jaapia argillacea MUCL 33604]|uniref:Phospholipase C/P1 nuclease n=1 Tax=Jaapia argillacea MUCL 33604 TaxID=933084 RepID=A0A067Q909_9AGAM|nr:hypothetical protein JAAARDRAFT_67657 [Jaapia argillacea MUCL 33604]